MLGGDSPSNVGRGSSNMERNQAVIALTLNPQLSTLNPADSQVAGVTAWAEANDVRAGAAVRAAEAGAPPPDTPAAWFAGRHPALEKRFGIAVEEVYPEDYSEAKPWVKD